MPSQECGMEVCAEEGLAAAADGAFRRSSLLTPLEAFVRFGVSVRGLLQHGRTGRQLWPDTREAAQEVRGRWLYRLCGEHGETTVRRLSAAASLHFLAADVFQLGGELMLELLWYASSNDRCVRMHTQGGSAYYSYADTLPAAHLVHFQCAVQLLDAAERFAQDALTVSYSGFLSVTGCRLHKATDLERRLAAESPPAGEQDGSHVPGADVKRPWATVELGSGAQEWEEIWRSPQPLRICQVPRPRRRRVSACANPLHDAARVHQSFPHAVEDWLNYHKLIGIEHFTLFDVDGSFAPYLKHFIEDGFVTYYDNWPRRLQKTFGDLANNEEALGRRPLVANPHALDACLWANRQVSDWIVVVHNFEEYLHSPLHGEALDLGLVMGMFDQLPQTVAVLLEQAPFGAGPMVDFAAVDRRSIFSAFQHRPARQDTQSSFAYFATPLNVVQTHQHTVQPRADGQAVLQLSPDFLRLNHYIDMGSNRPRCRELPSGCDVEDAGIRWAEAHVVAMRRQMLMAA
eukprot:TRINITY_DN41541_c0_g1_i2.p1 TRINITY_DN41541_c0_g1~~TRINITY_DN41541_c0_g1_i2.p1  ORF type:complete len:516 (-),score=49.91 TRINITY_DN41541_c0_g1_i2:264-1811(-)